MQIKPCLKQELPILNCGTPPPPGVRLRGKQNLRAKGGNWDDFPNKPPKRQQS